MRNKINRTGFVATGAAALLVVFAGNIQAISVSASIVRAYETTRALESSQAAQTIARETAALLAKSLAAHQALAEHESHASPVRAGINVVPVRPATPGVANASDLRLLSFFPVDLPMGGEIALGDAIYHIPTPILSVPWNGWETASVSTPAATVMDGGSTAMLLSSALTGALLLRRKLAA